MQWKKKPVFLVLLVFLAVVVITLGLLITHVLSSRNIPVVYPDGWVAAKERNLFFLASALMLLVVTPVFILMFLIVWFYRESNKKSNYQPEFSHSHLFEGLWWAVPCAIVIVIAIATYLETFRLDPYRPLDSNKNPLTIQVVALQWKWLFIYPEQKIATVNFVQFPEKTPIKFEITADAPMNSLWIPRLSGQIFAMPAMRTLLHVIADRAGDYRGASANISGVGFAGMHFIARASSNEEFQQFVEATRGSAALTVEEYQKIATPSENNPVASYSLEKNDLFEWILMKYMAH